MSAPDTLVAELTYACPLRCAYCSNPTSYTRQMLSTDAWKAAIAESAAIGVLQLHLTGGEPLLRDDLEALITEGRAQDLYVNLITSGLPLARSRLEQLRDAGLDHVQLSFQSADAAHNDRLGGIASFSRKKAVARWVTELGLRLTLNVVLHRGNIHEVPQLVALGRELGAQRIELANTQFLGSALANRDALLPTRAQLEVARAEVARLRPTMNGIELTFVLPDYLAATPRACMGGWAQRYLVIAPDGAVLPCQAASAITTLAWERVGQRALADIWRDSPALVAYRGEAWMKPPCNTCERRTLDFGGCRCQAFLLTGDAAATDPACTLSPDHALVESAIGDAASAPTQMGPGRRLKLLSSNATSTGED
ncbi:MAG: pyrroloquinoline quinone biosynthesis protein PqqE [Polyangia bacterium]